MKVFTVICLAIGAAIFAAIGMILGAEFVTDNSLVKNNGVWTLTLKRSGNRDLVVKDTFFPLMLLVLIPLIAYTTISKLVVRLFESVQNAFKRMPPPKQEPAD